MPKQRRKHQEVARKKPTQPRAKVTVEAFLEAASRILVRDGYEATNTNRIAEEAGASVGSLYQYFRNKEAIVVTLIERMFEEEAYLLKNELLASESMPIFKAIEHLVTCILVLHEKNPKLRRVLNEQVPQVGRMGKLLDHQSASAAMVVESFQSRYHDLRPKNLELAAFIIVHAVESVVHATGAKRPTLLRSVEFKDELVALVTKYLVL